MDLDVAPVDVLEISVEVAGLGVWICSRILGHESTLKDSTLAVQEEDPQPIERELAIGQTGRDDGLAINVTAISEVSEISRGDYTAPLTAKRQRKLMQVELTYANRGRKPIDLLCGIDSAFRLVDSGNREFAPHNAAYDRGRASDESP